MTLSPFLHPFAPPAKDEADFVKIVRGEGAVVWDDADNRYVDAMGSLWYCNVGHGRAELAGAAASQMRQLAAYQTFEPFTNAPAEALAQRIAGIAPMDGAKVFFTPGGGSDAIDTAAKLARAYWHAEGQDGKQIIISRAHAYHGMNAYGTTLGLTETLRRFGTGSLADLTSAPARAAREGVRVVPMQAFLFEVLRPILTSTPECAAIYAPGGKLLAEGDTIRLPDLGDLLERLGAEGPGFLYTGDVAHAVSDWVLERGGMLSREDLNSYEPIEREPARVTYHGREVLTNPPPSSGGILIADDGGGFVSTSRPW